MGGAAGGLRPWVNSWGGGGVSPRSLALLCAVWIRSFWASVFPRPVLLNPDSPRRVSRPYGSCSVWRRLPQIVHESELVFLPAAHLGPSPLVGHRAACACCPDVVFAVHRAGGGCARRDRGCGHEDHAWSGGCGSRTRTTPRTPRRRGLIHQEPPPPPPPPPPEKPPENPEPPELCGAVVLDVSAMVEVFTMDHSR